ncbi:MAG TPA: ABC transporter ATP-binding protein [Bacillota bacterium]
MKLKVNDLSFYYHRNTPYQVVALDRVTFDANAGETVGLIGPNGAGKSCLLRCLAGLLTPFSGAVALENANTDSAPVGLIIQEPEQLFFANTVLEEVAYALTVRGRTVAAARETVERVLGKVGFEGDLKSSPFRLSGGQQRRVALASILVMDPELLLLDEPTIGMDRKGLAVLRNLITAYRCRHRITIIVSHDLDFLYPQVDRYLVLKAGKLIADFKKAEFPSYVGLLNENQIGLPEMLKLRQRKLPDYILNYLETL